MGGGGSHDASHAVAGQERCHAGHFSAAHGPPLCVVGGDAPAAAALRKRTTDAVKGSERMRQPTHNLLNVRRAVLPIGRSGLRVRTKQARLFFFSFLHLTLGL